MNRCYSGRKMWKRADYLAEGYQYIACGRPEQPYEEAT